MSCGEKASLLLPAANHDMSWNYLLRWLPHMCDNSPSREDRLVKGTAGQSRAQYHTVLKIWPRVPRCRASSVPHGPQDKERRGEGKPPATRGEP